MQVTEAVAVTPSLDLQQVQQFWLSLPEGHQQQLLQIDCDEALYLSQLRPAVPIPGVPFREPSVPPRTAALLLVSALHCVCADTHSHASQLDCPYVL